MPRRYHELTALDAVAAIESGRASSERIVSACLERITLREADVQAWAAIDRKRALADARAMDRAPRRSRLHGIPVGIKDVIDTSDLPTEHNSPIYSNYRPRADASAVSLLRKAGCVILGKTVTTEFANISAAPTRNPHDLKRSPGGSSSGSAAAVADFMVPFALGTQTAGSIIRPAAYCGDYAIKPTFGSINRTGVKPLAESLDTVGIFARDPSDLAAAMEILSGRLAVPSVERVPNIGFCRTANWHHASRAVQDMLESVLDSLSKSGAQVRDIELPQAIDDLPDDHAVVMGYESARALSWEYETYPEKLSPALLQRLQDGWSVSRVEYDRIQRKAGDARIAFGHLIKDFDFILTPSAEGIAPELTTTGNSRFNRAWTLLGNPCVAVPIKTDADGMPVGAQIVGDIGADMELINWAGWLKARLS